MSREQFIKARQIKSKKVVDQFTYGDKETSCEEFDQGADWAERFLLTEDEDVKALVTALEKGKKWFSEYGESADFELALERIKARQKEIE